MLLRLFLLLTLLPVAELMVMLAVHRAIAERWGNGTGLLITLGTIVLTGLAGAFLARRQGLRALRALQETLARGESPGPALIDAAFVVAGGALLLTPGYLTDLLGLSLLIPWTRRLYRLALLRWFRAKLARGEAAFLAETSPPPGVDFRESPDDVVIDVTPHDDARPD